MLQLIGWSFLLFTLSPSVYCDFGATLRQTSNGPVEGTERISSLGQKYYSFIGIPYAEPPITGSDPYTGEHVDRRFKAPESLKRKWTQPLPVHNLKKECVQNGFGTENGLTADSSEDCLILNIYVPAGGAEEKTVIVFIPGGAFQGGQASYASYGPDFLMTEDAIVVVMQYRVGIFGFLNLGHGEYTGNMGLKDQQMALKWISNNIEQFSGNKNEILLYGQSAGGASTSYQMVNEESRKYFKRAYAASSTSVSFYALSRLNHTKPISECSHLDKMDEIIEYVKTSSAGELAKCKADRDLNNILLTYGPSVEPTGTVGAFVTKATAPEEIYASDRAPIMDAMFSFASEEYVAFNPDLLDKTEPLIKEDWKETDFLLPFEGFTKDAYPKAYAQAVELLRESYFPDPSNIDAVRRGNIALWSDLSFIEGTVKAAAYQANANSKSPNVDERKNTFLMRFSINTELNPFKLKSEKNFTGAVHSDDLAYVFHEHKYDSMKVYDSHLESKDIIYDYIMRMVKMITNFARTGNPSIEGDTPFVSIKSSDEVYCQEMSNVPTTSVTANIKEQVHYNTWRAVEAIYKSLNVL